jgi:NarL family two-component system response regulator LiaR
VPEQQTIRVLIVDDHPMVREGLRTILQVFQDLELVGETSSGAEAIRLCAEKHPDIVLMDLSMPGMDGIRATRTIRESYPDIQVIVLTSFNQDVMIKEAIQAGAISYLLKTVSASELVSAMRNAKAGNPSFSAEVTRTLLYSAAQPPPPGHDLTTREREVLTLLVRGLSNIEIGQQLVVSPATVKGHLNNIFSKLHVHNRTEAATLALQHQLINR